MPNFPVLSLLLAAILWAPAARAAPGISPATLAPRLPEVLPCISAAADYHGVNPWVLRAILKVESDFNPSAVNRNANGTLDVGMAQINSIHFAELARWGIAPSNLMDGCIATYVAAWHLARQIKTYGNSWFAIASYHSASPCQNTRYAGLLWNVLVGWGVAPGPRLKVADAAACQPRRPAARPARRADVRTASALAFDESR
jgi:soluble lytic murein transglycosylase-like protein